MTAVADLLPQSAGTATDAIARALSDELQVPFRVTLDPDQTPAKWLPFLAANESVDLWFNDWTDARKRQMIAEARHLATLKGLRAGVVAFLGYVDGTMIDAVAYPARFALGRASIGRTPVGHMPFLARYLVKIETARPPRSFVAGRAVMGRSRIKTHSRDRLTRGLQAMRVAKSVETECRADFAHRRRLRIGDGVALDGGFNLDQFLDRTRL